MYESIIESPLFLWSILAYLILLYHSFGIEEVQMKIRSVELLFVSLALGTVFLFVFNFLWTLVKVVIEGANSLIEVYNVLPVTFNPFQPELHEPGTTWPEYYALVIIIFIFVYLVGVWTFAIIIRLTQFCLDSEKNIFCKYKRFNDLKKYNIVDILLNGIPSIFVFISISLLAVTLILGFWTNLSFLPNIIFLLELLLAITATLIVVIMELFLATILYYNVLLVKPLAELFISKVKKARKNNMNHNVPINQSKVMRLITRYQNELFVLLLVNLFLMITMDFNNKQVSLFEWIFFLILLLLVIILIRYKKKNNQN